MRRVLISTKPFIYVLFLVGVTVRSAESLSSAIPLGTSTKRANSKRANNRRSRLFQDAVSSVSSGCGRFLTRANRRCWNLLFLRRRENSATPSPGGGPGGESSVSVLTTFSRKSNFLFLRVLRSMGRQCAMPCFLTLAHDPFCQ